MLTTKEAAKFLKVSISQVQKMIYRGQLEAVKKEGRWKIHENDLAKAKKHKKKPGRPRQ